MGYLLLAGGAEFGGQMIDADRRAIDLAGGPSALVNIIPAAAAPDNNHIRAGQNGVEWFKKIGAQQVISQPLTNQSSAQLPEISEALMSSKIIYLVGGFPSHLADSLRGTLSWQSIQSVFTNGGIIGGSSAGAMVLCEFFYDPSVDRVLSGLGMLPRMCIIPHFNRYGRKWLNRLSTLLPDILLLGLDEETAIINDAASGGWHVYGKGAAYLFFTSTASQSYSAGKVIDCNELRPPQN